MNGYRWLWQFATGILLLLGLLTVSGRAEAGTAPQPAAVPLCCPHLPPCAATVPPDTRPPTAPQGLVGELQPYSNATLAPEVHLQWQPVPDATCIMVETLHPDPLDWAGGVALPGTSTDTNTEAPVAGESCFRIIAYNPAGLSPYSDETCVDVPGAPSFPAGWNLVSNTGSGNILVGTDGPIYCPRDTDGLPKVVQPGSPMVGPACWAYFDAPTTEFLAAGRVQLYGHGQLPTGQWILSGNSSAIFPERFPFGLLPAGSFIEVWDPSTSSYQMVTVVPPGQGAWVWPSSAAP